MKRTQNTYNPFRRRRMFFAAAFAVFSFFLFNASFFSLSPNADGEFFRISFSPETAWADRCGPLDWNCVFNGGELDIKGIPGDIAESIGDKIFKPLLVGMLWVGGKIVATANVLVLFVMNPGNVYKIFNNAGVYGAWIAVRDFINLGFILVLLFSAFATIFQVEKYHIKKIILSLVIMALLVNFSFPITRFVIDTGNVPMFFLASNLFSRDDNNFLPSTAEGTRIVCILAPHSDKSCGGTADDMEVKFDLGMLLAMNIFLFLFAFTVFVIAILFVIRLVVLAVLLIFSPVGFVASIFPSTAGYASSWWTTLFKQTFFGPIMLFVLSISVILMNHIQLEQSSFIKEVAEGNATATGDGNFAGDIALFTIPLVILWVGLISAGKMGAMGANVVVGRASKVARWAGMKFSGVNALRRTWSAYSAKRQEAAKGGAFARAGARLSAWQDRLTPTRAAQLRYERERVRGVKEASERHDMENANETRLQELAKSGSKETKAAAILALAKRGVANPAQLGAIRTSFGVGSMVTRQIENEMRKYNPVAVIGRDVTRLREFARTPGFDPKKLSAEALQSAELMEAMFEERILSPKTIEEIRGKGGNYETSIKASLGALAGTFKDTTTDMGKNIQTAHFAQTGEFHSSIASDATKRAAVASGLDKESAKRISSATLSEKDYVDSLLNNMNPAQFKNMIQNMNKDAQKVLLQRAREMGVGATPVSNVVLGDPELRNLHL